MFPTLLICFVGLCQDSINTGAFAACPCVPLPFEDRSLLPVLDCGKILNLRGIIYFIKMFCLNLYWITFNKTDIIIVDYSLVKIVLIPLIINKIIRVEKQIKYILDIRTLPVDIRSFEEKILKLLFSLYYAKKYFNGITYITNFMKEYLDSIGFINNNLLSIIWSSSVDIDLFNPNRFLKKDKNYFEVFYHGGISISRGCFNLVKAVEILRNKGYPIKLKMIGRIVDYKILNYIKSKNIDSYINILSPKPIQRMPALIAECDLPVLPFPKFIGWRVSSPIKLFEYLAMEKIVVATNIEAFTNIFRDNQKFVIYSKTSKPRDLASTILYVFKNFEELKFYNKNSRKFIVNNYTWQHQALKLNKFFSNILNVKI